MPLSVHRLGKAGWRIIAVSALLYVAGAAVAAASWRPETEPELSAPEDCADPPCFDTGGMPEASDLPVIAPMVGFLAAVVLGVPALFKWFWSQARRRPEEGAHEWLLFFGPLLVFVGVEVVPHLLSPCALAWLTDASSLPRICTRSQHGIDVKDQWHPLSHALAGGLPMAGLYWLALRRWQPALLKAPAESD